MSENSSNVKPKGLHIPDPIRYGLNYLTEDELGRAVIFMSQWLDRLPNAELYDGLSETGKAVVDVWKAMLSEGEDD